MWVAPKVKVAETAQTEVWEVEVNSSIGVTPAALSNVISENSIPRFGRIHPSEHGLRIRWHTPKEH